MLAVGQGFLYVPYVYQTNWQRMRVDGNGHVTLCEKFVLAIHMEGLRYALTSIELAGCMY
jgi:hypothetical protein